MLAIGIPSGWEWVLLALLIVCVPVVALVLLVTAPRRKARRAAQVRAALDPDEVCAQLFSGAPTVSYQLSAVGLPFEVVVQGAIARGYRLEAQSPTGMLVFSHGQHASG